MKKILVFIYWNIFAKVFLIFPVQEKIFFESFLGESYSCNPRYIFEYMKEKNYNFNYVWSFKNKDEHIVDSKKIKRLGIKYLYHLNTSKYIITNSRMPDGYDKRLKQKYIQTWHGTPLKRLVYSIKSYASAEQSFEKYLEKFSKDTQKWDLLLAPNEFSKKEFEKCFKYGKEIIVGYPRNDIDITKINKNKIKKDLGLIKNKKIILYTPTYRDNKNKKSGHYSQEINIDTSKIKDYYILYRGHYLIKDIKFKYSVGTNFIDVTKHENINDLFAISDMLITDYSSSFFDYMYLKKPIILYQYDQQEYKDEIRGFNIKLDELPCTIIKNEINLYKNIDKYIGTSIEYDYFLDKFNLNKSENYYTVDKIVNKILEL